eukprot:1044039-Prymnesium_polylepis.1
MARVLVAREHLREVETRGAEVGTAIRVDEELCGRRGRPSREQLCGRRGRPSRESSGWPNAGRVRGRGRAILQEGRAILQEGRAILQEGRAILQEVVPSSKRVVPSSKR